MSKTRHEIELLNNALLYAALVGTTLVGLVWMQYSQDRQPREPIQQEIVESVAAPPIPKK